MSLDIATRLLIAQRLAGSRYIAPKGWGRLRHINGEPWKEAEQLPTPWQMLPGYGWLVTRERGPRHNPWLGCYAILEAALENPDHPYAVYHINFPSMEAPLAAKRGYIGITRQPVLTRWNQHESCVINGSGYALHTLWRALRGQEGTHVWGDSGQVVDLASASFTVITTASSLPTAYALEEELVGKYTLATSPRNSTAPGGLNVIPGGYAGIKMLHQLGYTNKKKLGPDEREHILTAIERAGPCPHYRIGHWREYKHTRYINAQGTREWIAACFIGEPNAVT